MTSHHNLNKEIVQWGRKYLSSQGYTLKSKLPENVQNTASKTKTLEEKEFYLHLGPAKIIVAQQF